MNRTRPPVGYTATGIPPESSAGRALLYVQIAESERRKNMTTELHPVVQEAIDSYAKYYAEHHKLGLSIRDDMRYVAEVATRWATPEDVFRDAVRWRTFMAERTPEAREGLARLMDEKSVMTLQS